MRNFLGIYTKGLENKVGSLFVGIAVVKPNFFRKNYISDNIILNNAVLEHFYVYKISPSDIKKQIQFYELEGIIGCLNTYYQFWKHNIFIQCSSPETFKDIIPINLPANLKKENISISKWNISKSINHPILKLVRKMVTDYFNDEQEYIKKIYGDYKTDDEFIRNNPNNPYIRNI